jgi:hypothetical protein
MPSIFIWKADIINTSKKYITIYSGSNWILEQHDNKSKSYKYIDQIVIPGFNNTVITYDIEFKSEDYVGSELLEVKQLPYSLIKSDNYGTLEHIGEWMQFTLLKNVDYTKETMVEELNNIKHWLNTKEYTKPNIRLDPDKIEKDFKEFLIKFTNKIF